MINRDITYHITTNKGYPMFLDNIDSLLLSKNRVHEPMNTHIIDSLLNEGDTFLDIGAHIGYYTLIASKIVGETGKVFAFEPDPTNFALLNRNIEANKCKNVTAVQKAVSNKTETTKLYISPDNTGDNRIYDIHLGWESTDIETITIDDYFKDYPKQIDFVKMDIQGSEGLTVEGMHHTLQKNDHIIMITEFFPSMMIKAGTDPTAFLKAITYNGADLYYTPFPPIEMIKVSIDGILESCTDEQPTIDLLCTKNLIIQYNEEV